MALSAVMSMSTSSSGTMVTSGWGGVGAWRLMELAISFGIIR